jgi:hypothetical protein
MCHDELARCVEVLFLAEPNGKRLLVFLAEHGHAADCLDIGIEAADRAGQHVVLITKG